nr:immunoglobulin heavy chain junction region [Mus musculus]
CAREGYYYGSSVDYW